MQPSAHDTTPIFPHCLSTADIAGPGPSPWVTCSRPSCRLLYRTTAFIRIVTPPCPMCGQVALPPAQGHMTRAQRAAVVPFFAAEVALTCDTRTPQGDNGGAR